MKESEAVIKWCPMVREPFYVEDSSIVGGNNRSQRGDWSRSYCIGSDCAMWRWNEPMVNGPDSYVSEPGPEGFCGLAGREVIT